MLGSHVQDRLVGAVPVPLRPRMGDPAPRHGPRAWLRHDGLREGEIPRKQHVEAQTTGGQGFDGRSVTVAVTCNETCELIDVPGAPEGPLDAGRPTLVTIDLSRAKLPLRLTVADPAGNRTTAGASLSVVR